MRDEARGISDANQLAAKASMTIGNRAEVVKTALRQALLLALLALVPAALSAFFAPRPVGPGAPLREGEITVETATRNPAAYFWIDARPAVQYAAKHIPGALPLNEDAWDELLPPVLLAWPTAMPAIVYCDSRHCDASEAVALRLRELNVAPVFILKGGWEAWLAGANK